MFPAVQRNLECVRPPPLPGPPRDQLSVLVLAAACVLSRGMLRRFLTFSGPSFLPEVSEEPH